MSVIENRFQSGQKVWWLNTSFWRVRHVTIVRRGRLGKQWGIKLAYCRSKVVRDSDLFSNQADAYKEGNARLIQMAESLSAKLSEVLMICKIFADEAKSEGDNV